MIISKCLIAIFTFAVLIPRQGFGLTIDNQLVIIANDCYTRIAIGSSLPTKYVAASVTAATVVECEDECSRKRSSCEVFSFGISAKGNATCLLGNSIPAAKELEENSDYDIYIRQQSSPSCLPDRLYKLGSGNRRNPSKVNDAPAPSSSSDSFNKEKGSHGSKDKPITGSVIPGPGGFGTVTISGSSEVRPNFEPNAERPPNRDQNYPNYGYQVTGGVHYVSSIPTQFGGEPNHGYPGVLNFDEDNPNAPYSYANNKNSHGHYGGPINGGNYYAGAEDDFNHGTGDRGQNYHVHVLHENGNRYGPTIYETPDEIHKSLLKKLFFNFYSNFIDI